MKKRRSSRYTHTFVFERLKDAGDETLSHALALGSGQEVELYVRGVWLTQAVGYYHFRGVVKTIRYLLRKRYVNHSR